MVTVTNPSPTHCTLKTSNPAPSLSPTPPHIIFCKPHSPDSPTTKFHRYYSISSLSADFPQTPTVHNPSSRNRVYFSTQFTVTGSLYSLFQEIGIGEEETQLLLEKTPNLGFISHECIRSRIHSLRSVGIDGFALSRVIAKRPEVLTAQEMDSLLCCINSEFDLELEPSKLERLLVSTEPSFFGGFSEKVRLLVDKGIPRDKLSHVLNNVNIPKAICFRSVEELERTIVYLSRFGGDELIVRRPALLNFDLNSQLVPRVGLLLELSGGDEDATGVLLRKLPAILTYTTDHVQNHVEFLRSFAGLDDPEIFKIVLVYPNVMSVSVERKLHPRVDFLKQCGLDSNDIFRFLTKAPLFVALSFRDNLSKKLGFLLKIGYENQSKELAIAMGAVTRTSCENMQKVIGIFLTYGLSFEDILVMSKRHPQVLQYNPGSLEKKMEYLIDDIGRDIGELLAFPAFLGYKLDDRIKHRYEVKKKLIGEGMSLNKLLSVSTERFSKKNKPKKVKKAAKEEKIEGRAL